MKVVFVSNYFNHHQQPFCDAMYRLIGEGYVFVATTEMREERKKLGYNDSLSPGYVKKAYISKSAYRECINLINEADVVIAGSAPENMLIQRIRRNKLVFRYQERLFKRKKAFRENFVRAVVWFLRNFTHKNIYLLCASAFTAADCRKIGLFRNRAYKWGYFPEAKQYRLLSLLNQKSRRRILWCGRLIPWKRPEYALYVAKRLSENGYDFSMEIVGDGEMKEFLQNEINKLNLSHCVKLIGAIPSQDVRKHMEEAGIFLFTSTFEEGWGAVLNEAMNSACAVVASHAIGSVPFLVEDEVNGLIYISENKEDLYQKTRELLINYNKQQELGVHAYATITNAWNAETAACRFLELVEVLQEDNKCSLFEEGPCSAAQVLLDNWYGEV